MALYDTFAGDTRLSERRPHGCGDGVQSRRRHRARTQAESKDFAPFGGADYRDAVGPTVHFATNPGQLDPWAPKVSETHTAFYKEVGAKKLDHALLA
jgi:hypothetical protein